MEGATWKMQDSWWRARALGLQVLTRPLIDVQINMEVITEKPAPFIQPLLFSWEPRTSTLSTLFLTPAQLGAVVLAPHVVGGVEDVARGDARSPQQQQEAVGPLAAAPDQWEAES